MTDLEAEDFRLDEGKRFAIDLDESFAFLRMLSVHSSRNAVKMLV